MAKRIVLTEENVLTLRPRGKSDGAWRDLNSPVVLRVQGKRRAFTVRTRLDGEVRRYTIGEPGVMPLDQAREDARRIVAACARGENPSVERARREVEARDARARTFGAVVEDFAEKYARPRQKTWRETRRTLLVNCAEWRDRPITTITRRDAYALLDGFIADGHGHKARVTLAWLRKLWRWAWERDLLDSPLMDAVSIDFERTVRDRHYSDEEVRAVWLAADQLSPLEGGFVKLLLLLGVRKGELAAMRRSEFDDPIKPTLWTVPHERTKTKKRSKRERVYLVPLPPLARRIVKGLPRLDDDFVFPGRHRGKPLNAGTPLKTKVREGSGVEDWSYHPCRDTLATWLQDEGHSEYERGLVLNHAGAGTVTADYSHGFPVELKRKLLYKWARHVSALVMPNGATEVIR